MIRTRRAAWPVAAVLLLVTAVPAHAHGLGGRLDLPIPIWHFAWAAAFAVLVSFAVLGRYWTYPRLAPAARGAPFPPALESIARGLLPITRLIGVAILAVTIHAAFLGIPDVTSNLAPFAAFVLVWVGVAVASAFVGDVWATVNPFTTLANLCGRIHRSVHPDIEPEPAQAAESISLPRNRGVPLDGVGLPPGRGATDNRRLSGALHDRAGGGRGDPRTGLGRAS